MTSISPTPRRILLIGRDYFFYTRAIADTLRSHIGADVDCITIEPGSRFYNLARRVPKLAQWWQDRHHRNALARHGNTAYDLLLFVQVHQLEHRLGWYRAQFPNTPARLYYWDSLATHDYSMHVPQFDAVFTFDPVDAEQNSALTYLPLFFTPAFRALRDVRPRPHDLSFVGTAVNRTRYDQLTALREKAGAQGLLLFDYLLVSPFFYLRELLAGRRLRRVHFRPMPPADVMRAYAQSAAVLDLPNNRQTGFTMRTFETLGAHRKLVTTNLRAATAPFHSPETVCVMTPGSDFPTRDWLRAETAFPDAIETYSLETWAETLLGLTARPEAIDKVAP